MLPPLCFDLSALLRSLVLLAGLGKNPLARNYMLLYLHHAPPDHVCAEGFLPVSSGDPSCVLLGGCTKGVVNGLGISHKLLMGLGVSDFVSVGHIFAFLSSHYTFSSRARILESQSRRLGESRVYHSPPLTESSILFLRGILH